MNKVLSGGLLSLALLAGVSGGASLASADGHEGEHERPEKPPIEKSYELLNNGAQVTLTYTGDGDFSEFVEKFQERQAEKEARRADRQASIDHNVEIGEDSIVITITSDDADAIERIQQRAEEGPRKGSRRGGRSEHQRAD